MGSGSRAAVRRAAVGPPKTRPDGPRPVSGDDEGYNDCRSRRLSRKVHERVRALSLRAGRRSAHVQSIPTQRRSRHSRREGRSRSNREAATGEPESPPLLCKALRARSPSASALSRWTNRRSAPLWSALFCSAPQSSHQRAVRLTQGQRRGADAGLTAGGLLTAALRTGLANLSASGSPSALERSPARAASVLSEVPAPRSGSSAPVFTGDLLPSNRAAGSLDPFALQAAFPPSLVARNCHDYYGSSATPRRQQRTVRLPRTPDGFGGHRRGASHVHSLTSWQGRRPAVLRGQRRALPQHGTRPRPSEQSPDGRDGPEGQPGPSTPAAHSRQFPG